MRVNLVSFKDTEKLGNYHTLLLILFIFSFGPYVTSTNISLLTLESPILTSLSLQDSTGLETSSGFKQDRIFSRLKDSKSPLLAVSQSTRLHLSSHPSKVAPLFPWSGPASNSHSGMATTPVAGSAPATLEKKPVKFSNLLCEPYSTVYCCTRSDMGET